MGDLAELSLPTRLFLRAYRWRRIDPVPWSSLGKPLAECRVALASSAGLVLPGQEPFDAGVRGGDWNWREIPAGAEVAALSDTQRSEQYDHGGIAADRNLAFPLDRLRELVAAGRIGSLAPRHASLYSTRRGCFAAGTSRRAKAASSTARCRAGYPVKPGLGPARIIKTRAPSSSQCWRDERGLACASSCSP